MSSPAGAPTRTVDVTDIYAGNAATVDCNGATAGAGVPTSLAGGGTLNCTYTVALGSKVTGINTATAALTNNDGSTTNFTGTAEVVAGDWATPDVETDESITVDDTVDIPGAPNGRRERPRSARVHVHAADRAVHQPQLR